MPDTLGEDHIGQGVVGPQGQDLSVGKRTIPAARILPVRKLDDDEMPGPFVLEHVHVAAMDKKAPAKRLQRGIDPLQILDNLRTHCDLAHMGDGVGGHG